MRRRFLILKLPFHRLAHSLFLTYKLSTLFSIINKNSMVRLWRFLLLKYEIHFDISPLSTQTTKTLSRQKSKCCEKNKK